MTTLAIPTTSRRKDQINHFDITKKLEIIRDIVETKDDIDAHQKPPLAPKRKLNIPVGDVSTDPEYEKIVKPNYKLSQSYLKYMKKIGDDEDVSIDYNMEDEDLTWISSHPRLSNDREVLSHLTVPAFEKIIDILEKQTGVLKDAVPVFHVEKLVAEMLNWSTIVAGKIVPEVYQHWLNKREALQKPLCRKFWPVTNANDSCPYHVFRVRDKERYRLRKQQRKNDLESFRKMQTLKKEFNKAKILVQLVLEREKLHEAELEIQKEIFEQTLYDMSNHRGVPRQKIQYKHKLSFPELLIVEEKIKPVPIQMPVHAPILASFHRHSNKISDVSQQSSEYNNNLNRFTYNQFNTTDVNPTIQVPNSGNEMKFKFVIGKNSSTSSSGSTFKHPSKSISSIQNNENDKNKYLSSTDHERKRKKKKNIKVDGQLIAKISSISNAAIDASIPYIETSSVDVNESTNLSNATSQIPDNIEPIIELLPLLYPDLPGPLEICRPQWPNFMSNLNIREKINTQSTVSDYIDSLEFRSGIMPNKFRSRGRIGRGGRLIIDRIPVYDESNETDSAEGIFIPTYSKTNPINYFVPASLPIPIYRKKNVTQCGGSFVNNNSTDTASNYVNEETNSTISTNIVSNAITNNNLISGTTSRAETPLNLVNIPPSNIGGFWPPLAIMPPIKSNFCSILASRQKDIYACSDSEDEKIEIPKLTINNYRIGEISSKTPLDPLVKYTVRI